MSTGYQSDRFDIGFNEPDRRNPRYLKEKGLPKKRTKPASPDNGSKAGVASELINR